MINICDIKIDPPTSQKLFHKSFDEFKRREFIIKLIMLNQSLSLFSSSYENFCYTFKSLSFLILNVFLISSGVLSNFVFIKRYFL